MSYLPRIDVYLKSLRKLLNFNESYYSTWEDTENNCIVLKTTFPKKDIQLSSILLKNHKVNYRVRSELSELIISKEENIVDIDLIIDKEEKRIFIIKIRDETLICLLNRLPDDMLKSILNECSYDELHNFRTTSKKYCDLIKSNNFWMGYFSYKNNITIKQMSNIGKFMVDGFTYEKLCKSFYPKQLLYTIIPDDTIDISCIKVLFYMELYTRNQIFNYLDCLLDKYNLTLVKRNRIRKFIKYIIPHIINNYDLNNYKNIAKILALFRESDVTIK